MPKNRIWNKILCAFCSIPLKKFDDRDLTNGEIETLNESAKLLSKWKLGIYDYAGISISQLKATTRKSIIKDKIEIVFIDYMGRIQGDKRAQNKHMEIDSISKGLQDIALEFNIPVICLAQLNRNIYMRPDKQPVLADLRESGSIEEDADVVMLINRPRQFDASKLDNTEIIVAKNRILGDLGKTTYAYKNGILEELPYIESLQPNHVTSPNVMESKRPKSTFKQTPFDD